MTRPIDEMALRQMLLMWIDALIKNAKAEGFDEDAIVRGLVATSLLAAAQMHHDTGVSDQSFMAMAQRSLAIVRTGEMEQ